MGTRIEWILADKDGFFVGLTLSPAYKIEGDKIKIRPQSVPTCSIRVPILSEPAS